MSRLRRCIAVSCLLFAGSAIGCQTPVLEWPSRLVHELKPHRLSRLNQGPSLGREHANFSVSDETATANADE